MFLMHKNILEVDTYLVPIKKGDIHTSYNDIYVPLAPPFTRMLNNSVISSNKVSVIYSYTGTIDICITGTND